MGVVTRAEIVEFANDYFAIQLFGEDHDDLLRASGFDGDDAFEFIEAFSERFSVNMDGYIWEFHHYDEGGLLIPSWPFRHPNSKVQKIPISVDLLLASAQSGVWSAEYPSGYVSPKRYDILNLIALPALAVLAVLLITFLVSTSL